MQHYDVVVIGAGIVGLAVAHELLTRWPRLRVAVIDKETAVGAHQTRHNSGVIHSGLYYRPGSLKAVACLDGRARLLNFCQAHQVPFRITGKLVVAVRTEELPHLLALYHRGQENGIKGLELFDQAAQWEHLEPHVAGLGALYVPTTGITDYGQVATALARAITQRGGEIRLGQPVTRIVPKTHEVIVETAAGSPEAADTVHATVLIACAGLAADRVARMAGLPREPRIVPFRGSYYHLARPDLVHGLIYPVPLPELPFLGVHFTPTLDGEVWVGPNAMVAWAREVYIRHRAVLRDSWDILSYAGFWRFLASHAAAGWRELREDWLPAHYLQSVNRYLPEVTRQDLHVGHFGIRAQCVSSTGQLVDDFLVEEAPHQIHVRNAPSPAATSSFALAHHIAELAMTRYGWPTS